MHIKGLFPGLVNPLGWKRHAEPVEPAEKKPTEPAGASAPAASASGAVFREVVSQYRLTDISPRAFSEMLQKLHEAGAISDAEFQELSLIRLDLDLEGIRPDQSVDLPAVYAARLESLRHEQDMLQDQADPRSAGQATLAATQRRLEWLRKVGTIQSPQGAGGLDKTA